MRFRGSWTVARPWGIPIRVHWSVLLFALLSGGFAFRPGAWLGSLLLILAHELGHAFVVRRVGARATAVDVLGFGGLCWWEGSVSPLGRAAIAWGGIWAQLVVFAIAAIFVTLRGYPEGAFAHDMVRVALMNNLYLAGFNLLPVPPLDGAEAWALFPLLWRRLRRGGGASSKVTPGVGPSFVRAAPRAPIASGKPAPVRATARVQVVAPRLDRRQIERPAAVDSDDVDERDFTPEVAAVIDRARAIAREAAREASASPPPASDKTQPTKPDPDRDAPPKGSGSRGN